VGTEVQLIVEEVERIASLGELLKRIEGKAGGFVWGDFGLGGAGRYSYLGIQPREVISFRYGDEGDPFALLDTACRKYRCKRNEDFPAPFVGGWAGYLGYDLGRYTERLPDAVEHDITLPLLWFGFYDALLAWDNEEQKGYLLALEYAGQLEAVTTRLARLKNLAEAGEGQEKESQEELSIEPPVLDVLLQTMQRNIAREDYLEKVAQSVEYIKAGDIFEVNLSQRFSCAYGRSAGILYAYLARHNPAGYAGMLQQENQAVVSASPELFLSKRGERIGTRPIKGTVARGQDEEEDRRNRGWLERSEKDIAELNMIIDLERNDLGRVCEYGTVEVLAEREIEAHPTVYHAVATVAGQLREGVEVGDILRATFPGGSITGAPKIRAMEIIDELEPTARSVYTGSIGWIGVNGDMDLNIAIRTVILEHQRAYVQAGGAVVADSDPQAEYEETLAKAAALVKALWVTGKVTSKKVKSG